MPDEMQEKINEFAVDICRLEAELKRLSRRCDPAERPTAAEQARRSYEELLRRMGIRFGSIAKTNPAFAPR